MHSNIKAYCIASLQYPHVPLICYNCATCIITHLALHKRIYIGILQTKPRDLCDKRQNASREPRGFRAPQFRDDVTVYKQKMCKWIYPVTVDKIVKYHISEKVSILGKSVGVLRWPQMTFPGVTDTNSPGASKKAQIDMILNELDEADAYKNFNFPPFTYNGQVTKFSLN